MLPPKPEAQLRVPDLTGLGKSQLRRSLHAFSAMKSRQNQKRAAIQHKVHSNTSNWRFETPSAAFEGTPVSNDEAGYFMLMEEDGKFIAVPVSTHQIRPVITHRTLTLAEAEHAVHGALCVCDPNPCR